MQKVTLNILNLTLKLSLIYCNILLFYFYILFIRLGRLIQQNAKLLLDLGQRAAFELDTNFLRGIEVFF